MGEEAKEESPLLSQEGALKILAQLSAGAIIVMITLRMLEVVIPIGYIIYFFLGMISLPILFFWKLNKSFDKIVDKAQFKLQKAQKLAKIKEWGMSKVKNIPLSIDDEEAPVISEGIYKIQFGLKHKKIKHYSIWLRGSTLFLQRRKATNEFLTAVPLQGASITKRINTKGKNGIDITHNSKALMDGFNSFSIIMETVIDVDRWAVTLEKASTLQKRSEIVNVWKPDVYPGKETCTFLNALIHRLWLNLRESPAVINKIKKRYLLNYMLKLLKRS